jgi:cytochrome c oxidase assembly protein subunit 15
VFVSNNKKGRFPQASLGIATLLFYVPTPLASSHQAGSLVLLSTALWLSHELKNMKYIPK